MIFSVGFFHFIISFLFRFFWMNQQLPHYPSSFSINPFIPELHLSLKPPNALFTIFIMQIWLSNNCYLNPSPKMSWKGWLKGFISLNSWLNLYFFERAFIGQDFAAKWQVLATNNNYRFFFLQVEYTDMSPCNCSLFRKVYNILILWEFNLYFLKYNCLK